MTSVKLKNMTQALFMQKVKDNIKESSNKNSEDSPTKSLHKKSVKNNRTLSSDMKSNETLHFNNKNFGYQMTQMSGFTALREKVQMDLSTKPQIHNSGVEFGCVPDIDSSNLKQKDFDVYQKQMHSSNYNFGLLGNNLTRINKSRILPHGFTRKSFTQKSSKLTELPLTKTSEAKKRSLSLNKKSLTTNPADIESMVKMNHTNRETTNPKISLNAVTPNNSNTTNSQRRMLIKGTTYEEIHLSMSDPKPEIIDYFHPLNSKIEELSTEYNNESTYIPPGKKSFLSANVNTTKDNTTLDDISNTKHTSNLPMISKFFDEKTHEKMLNTFTDEITEIPNMTKNSDTDLRWLESNDNSHQDLNNQSHTNLDDKNFFTKYSVKVDKDSIYTRTNFFSRNILSNKKSKKKNTD